MDNPLEFQPWPKIPRLNREVIITEKIDGTNAQILIVPRAEVPPSIIDFPGACPFMSVGDFVMLAGSRTRWLGHKTDNAGFAHWVSQNREELLKLGPGRHFGEWWGAGIQRRYGLTEKRFSLFNTHRWAPLFDALAPDGGKAPSHDLPGVLELSIDCSGPRQTLGPACCHVVPVIWRGTFDQFDIVACTEMLRSHGSFAARGFDKPEGIVVWHEAARQAFKVLLEGDDVPKGIAGISQAQMTAGVSAAQQIFETKVEGI